VTGATASLDGREVGELPVELHATPGSHAIHIVKPGYSPWDGTVAVSAGATAHARGELAAIQLRPVEPVMPVAPVQPKPVPAQPAPTQPVDHGSILGKWWLWTAVGAVVIGGAVITYEATRSPSPPPSELGVIKF
jgi:hypothetical protein